MTDCPSMSANSLHVRPHSAAKPPRVIFTTSTSPRASPSGTTPVMSSTGEQLALVPAGQTGAHACSGMQGSRLLHKHHKSCSLHASQQEAVSGRENQARAAATPAIPAAATAAAAAAAAAAGPRHCSQAQAASGSQPFTAGAPEEGGGTFVTTRRCRKHVLSVGTRVLDAVACLTGSLRAIACSCWRDALHSEHVLCL